MRISAAAALSYGRANTRRWRRWASATHLVAAPRAGRATGLCLCAAAADAAGALSVLSASRRAALPANVVAVRAVVGPPEQRCWVEQQQVSTGGGPNVPGAIIGGVLGGVLGHQIGSGRGNDVATAVGAVAGAAVGANVNRGSGQVYTQDVQRCAAVPGSAQPNYWDVTYVFRGVTHRAQLAFAPGRRSP